jgi:hypothetical protein
MEHGFNLSVGQREAYTLLTKVQIKFCFQMCVGHHGLVSKEFRQLRHNSTMRLCGIEDEIIRVEDVS